MIKSVLIAVCLCYFTFLIGERSIVMSMSVCGSTRPVFTKLFVHKHPFNGPLSRTARVSRYQKGTRKVKPVWILLKQETVSGRHLLGHMQVCTSLQTNNHASTPPLSFLQAGCPSCCPTNSVKASDIQSSPSLPVFRQRLKTFTFVSLFLT